MKLLLYAPIIACLFLTSCEKEIEDLEIETALTQSLEESRSQIIQEVKGDDTRGITPPTEEEIFINKMEWASFITAKIIYNSTESEKAAIRNLIVNRKIALEDLIGPNTQLQSFHNLFSLYLNDYLESISCPGDEEETPNKSYIENPTKTTEILIDEYLDYMLNQNCVELYFPVGVLSGDKDVISLSHPLTEYYGNYGYQRQGGCNSTFLAYIVSNHVYIHRLDYTYIIARPVRREMPGACHYSKYNGLDFTQFLGGNF